MTSRIYDLPIRELAHDGAGIGFIGACANSRGKAVFVPGALPGQIINCEIISDKVNFCRARLLEIKSSPSGFKAPHCPHYAECGGCPLQLLPYSEQLTWKQKHVNSVFERLAGIDSASFQLGWAVQSPCLLRNKIELAFAQTESGELLLGFRKRASHGVFNLTHCALIPSCAFPIINECRQQVANWNFPHSKLRFLTLRSEAISHPGEAVWTAILLTSPLASGEKARVRQLGERLLAECANLAQFVHEERKRKDMLAIGEKRALVQRKDGKKEASLRMELAGRQFWIDPASFFQVNPAGAEALAAALRAEDRQAGPLLDLFCGSGAPGQILAANHASCIGVEQDGDAICNARLNAANLPGWEYRQADVEKFLTDASLQKRHFSTALLDPARTGLVNAAALSKLASEQILYVSCNPSTLARDARILKDAYNLEQVHLVDMFPASAHVECLSVWSRKA